MSSGFCAGQMKLTSVLPGFISAISSAVGRAHLEDDVRTVHQLRGAAGDLGACGLVGLVAEVGGCPGAAFDADGEAELEQLLDHFRDGGNTFFAGVGFARHCDR